MQPHALYSYVSERMMLLYGCWLSSFVANLLITFNIILFCMFVPKKELNDLVVYWRVMCQAASRTIVVPVAQERLLLPTPVTSGVSFNSK